jgi:hypothetical protein
MAISLSCWAAEQRRGNTPLARERYATPQMKPPSQVGNGENYPSFDSTDRGVASLMLGVGTAAAGQAGPSQSRLANSNSRYPAAGSVSQTRAAGIRGQMPQSASQPRVPTATLIGRFSSMRRACSNDTVRSSCSSTHV